MQAEVILKYPVTFLTGFLVTFLFTPMLRRLAVAVGAVDRPGERRINTKVVPRLGGIAVFFGFHAACAVVQLVPWLPFSGQLDPVWSFDFLLASGALLVVGVVDDFWQLRPLVKLACQVLIAMAAFALDMRVGVVLGVRLPVPLDLLVTVLWYVVIINAFNLIDGIDGLATGLAAIAGLGLGGMFLFRHQPRDALIVLGLVGACVAFLRYNMHPASIFLGDSGAMFLGFVLAAVAVSTDSKGPAVSALTLPVLAFGVPLLDTVLAVWRRTVRRVADVTSGGKGDGNVGIFKADTEHVHHRLLKAGFSQRRVTAWLYLLGAFLVAVGLLSMMFRSHALGIYILAFVAGTYLVLRYLARIELHDSGMLIVRGLQRPAARVLVGLITPPLDTMVLALALGLTLWLLGPLVVAGNFRREWFDKLPVWVGIPFLMLCFAGVYQRIWVKARISDYVWLAIALGAGVLVAAGLSGAFGEYRSRTLATMTMIYWAFGFPFVAGLRVFPLVVQETVGALVPHDHRLPVQRILIYGTGDCCVAFLSEHLRLSIGGKTRERLVGLLDEDRSLHGRFVYGLRVVGGIADLPELCARRRIDRLVVTEPVPDEVRRKMIEFASRKGIAVCQWQIVKKDPVEPLVQGTVESD
ncbi:MAG: hypothetical protein N2255_07175 [Kiritimatiellae bacterium]|nr:hypothetical protein [Kiritimatiellia bacterium]